MVIGIPYVDRIIEVQIPESNLIFDLSPRDIPPVVDYGEAIRKALANPIGRSPLYELVRPGQKVIIISDDNTRLTPTKKIVPLLLDELNKGGVPDSDIRLIISSGTHRPMSEAEIDAKYGAPVRSRVAILPHNYKDPDELVDYGTTDRGTRILVNRHVIQADVRIAVGNIIPHHPSGWSGGAKAVLPGVAGEETVAQMHFLGCRYPALGEIDTPMRREMGDFAQKIGLDFIVNTILNRHGQLIHVVAGDFIDAHRVGVEKSRGVYGLSIPELADMTISSTSPIDFDLFQADKGITAAEPATRIGGEIVLVAGCLEGISPVHPELADYVGRMPNDQIWDLLYRGEVADPLTGAEAIVLNDIKNKMGITIVSEGLSPELCQALGFGHVWPKRLAEYIGQRLNEEPGLKVGVMRQSTELLPILES